MGHQNDILDSFKMFLNDTFTDRMRMYFKQVSDLQHRLAEAWGNALAAHPTADAFENWCMERLTNIRTLIIMGRDQICKKQLQQDVDEIFWAALLDYAKRRGDNVEVSLFYVKKVIRNNRSRFQSAIDRRGQEWVEFCESVITEAISDLEKKERDSGLIMVH